MFGDRESVMLVLMEGRENRDLDGGERIEFRYHLDDK